MIKKIKVAYLITKGNFGGAQKYVHDLATSLPSNEFEVKVILGPGGLLKEMLLEEGVSVREVPYLKRDINLFQEFLSMLSIYKALKKDKPDILHVNSSKAGGLGAFLGRLLGVEKIIYTVHGWPFKEERSWISKKVIWFFSWLTVLFSHQTVVISKEDLKLGLSMPASLKKMVLIYNGITPIDFLKKAASRERLGRIVERDMDEDSFWIGTIAEPTKNKGLEYLIEAIDILEDKPYVFVIGEGELKKELQQKSEDLGLGNRIFFTGYLEDAPKYLKAFDLFVLPSIKEGHPYTILEAGMAELPIIASNISGINDIIENNKTGILMPPAKPSKIAEAIVELRINRQKMALLGSNLKKKVEEEFPFKKTAAETIRLYKERT